jgi:hypothetical protein
VLADSVLSPRDPGDVPDQGPSARFSAVDVLTTLNAGGDLLFASRYAEGDGRGGVYLARGTTRYRVIDHRPDATWPGLTPGTRVGPNFDTFSVSPFGHIVLETELTEGDDTREAVILWDWDAGVWTELKGPGGEQASDLLTGVNDDGKVIILAGGQPYLATRTGSTSLGALPTVLEGATIMWNPGGGAINNAGRAVLTYQHTGSGKPGMIFWVGESWKLLSDVQLNTPLKGLQNLSLGVDARENRAGRSGMINDADEIVFRGILEVGGETIYHAKGQ